MLSEVTAARPGIIGMRLDLDDPGPLSRFTEEVRFRFPDLNVRRMRRGIPPRTDYKVSVAPRAALEAFLTVEDAEFQPTWQEVGDGSGNIRLDICTACSANP